MSRPGIHCVKMQSVVNYYFCFYFLFFTFNDSPSQKFTMSDFTKMSLLSYILPPPAVYVFGYKFLSICLSVLGCLELMNRSLSKNFCWLDLVKVTKRKSWILFWIQKIKNFQRSHFNVFFNEFGFLLDIS